MAIEVPLARRMRARVASLFASARQCDETPLGPHTTAFYLQMHGGAAQRCVVKAAGLPEMRLYQALLHDKATGAPALLGAWEEEPGPCLLALEMVEGACPDMADRAQVRLVYRHLGALHRHFAGQPPALPGSAAWAPTGPEMRSVLAATDVPPHVIEETVPSLMAAPVTLLHGDYHCGNLILTDGHVRVLDWEHAGTGHPAFDLTMLAPEEPGAYATPQGALATYALQVYHEAGPLAHLSWRQVERLQRGARLLVAARWALHHGAQAAQATGAAADLIGRYERRERERVALLCRLLCE